jgi:hypothetical protein
MPKFQQFSFEVFMPPRCARAGSQPSQAETEQRRQNDKDYRRKSESERRSKRAGGEEKHTFHPPRIDRFGQYLEQNRNIWSFLRFMVTQSKRNARYHLKKAGRISCMDRRPGLAGHDGTAVELLLGLRGTKDRDRRHP